MQQNTTHSEEEENEAKHLHGIAAGKTNTTKWNWKKSNARGERNIEKNERMS